MQHVAIPAIARKSQIWDTYSKETFCESMSLTGILPCSGARDSTHMSQAVHHDRRHTPRIPLEIPAQFMLQQSEPIVVQTVDASIGGVCIATSQFVVTGSPCMIAFDLMTQEGEKRINAWGVIVEVTRAAEADYHCRIAFTDMDTRSRYFMRQFTNEGTYTNPKA
jgi:hypothetical protein